MANWYHEHGSQYVPPAFVAELGGKDVSWRNDPGGACFLFGEPLSGEEENHQTVVVLWVDSADSMSRVYPESPRYTVTWPSETGELQTDSSTEALGAVEAALEWMDIQREAYEKEEAALLTYKY